MSTERRSFSPSLISSTVHFLSSIGRGISASMLFSFIEKVSTTFRMKSYSARKVFIIAVALSGVMINIVYGIGLLGAFFDPRHTSAMREILISAIVLEFGWTALLLWMVVKPFERRHILLLTIIPILLGNIFHSVNHLMDSQGSASAIALNMTIGLIYSGFYVVAFRAGKPDNNN